MRFCILIFAKIRLTFDKDIQFFKHTILNTTFIAAICPRYKVIIVTGFLNAYKVDAL